MKKSEDEIIASRDFFWEKQMFLLTEFPLSKYEGGTTPVTLLSYKKVFLTIWWGTQSQDEQKTILCGFMISTKYEFDWSKLL